MFIDGYDYEYIFMVLLDHGYKFTNMITLFNFFFYLNYRLVELNKSALLLPALDSLFNNEIIQYFGKEIIITDDDIDGILNENNKNIEEIKLHHIFLCIYNYYNITKYFSKKINWLKIKEYIEYYYKYYIVMLSINLDKDKLQKNKEIKDKWQNYIEILQNYHDINYEVPYPVFKLEFNKYKDEFDKFLGSCK